MRAFIAGMMAVMLLWPTAARAETPEAAWSDLGGLIQPHLIQQSNDLLGRQVTAAPGAPERLAYCGPDSIWVTDDIGETWSPVPVDGVHALATGTDYPLPPAVGSEPVCSAVALDPHDPSTVYAAFTAVKAPQDFPPPRYLVGYFTRDAGQTWQAVPIPEGFDAGSFGGFQADTNGVYALFGEPLPLDGPATPPVVQTTHDSGATWQTSELACPPEGPCVRWGQAPNQLGSCSMHGYAQPLLTSPNLGATWETPTGARGANACQPNQLAALSATEALLVTTGPSEIEPDAPPVRYTADGGLSWAPVTLPPAPNIAQLTLLPDGRLLALVNPGDERAWWMLEPGATEWCTLPAGHLPSSAAPLQVSGEWIAWLDAGSMPQWGYLPSLGCVGSPAEPAA